MRKLEADCTETIMKVMKEKALTLQHGECITTLCQVSYWSRSASNLWPHVSALGTHLVDLRLSDVGSLFSLVQLMLQLAELAQMSIGLLLLKDSQRTKKKKKHKIIYIMTSGCLLSPVFHIKSTAQLSYFVCESLKKKQDVICAMSH